MLSRRILRMHQHNLCVSILYIYRICIADTAIEFNFLSKILKSKPIFLISQCMIIFASCFGNPLQDDRRQDAGYKKTKFTISLYMIRWYHSQANRNTEKPKIFVSFYCSFSINFIYGDFVVVADSETFKFYIVNIYL